MLNEKQTKLQEIRCLVCNGSGIHLSQICPACLGHGVLFRLAEQFDYSLGMELAVVNYRKGS